LLTVTALIHVNIDQRQIVRPSAFAANAARDVDVKNGQIAAGLFTGNEPFPHRRAAVPKR